jgi:hypothetical protein
VLLNFSRINGLLWFLLILGPFIILKGALHKELQSVLYLVTRRLDVAYTLFYILFLPGVILHELSHYLMAVLLRVKTGRFSIVPRNMGDGRIQLGFVETAKADFLRDSIIGFAPLLTGCLFVGYVGTKKMSLWSLWAGLSTADPGLVLQAISEILTLPDIWLWFYLSFTVSSIMMPSESDRHTWLPVGLVIVFFIILGILTGVGPWMVTRLWEPVNNFLFVSSIIFLMSAFIHLVVFLPIFGVRKIISQFVKF